uniref:Protein ZIP4 homolog n=1 Tax=Oncorhynchus mykiss TaxID=8022 RepID=A0A8K9VBQ0_ONCMY
MYFFSWWFLGLNILEESAIQLWNWAVTKRVGTAINEHQKAKVRHVACRLLYSCEKLTFSLQMASKTGRTWLDCKKPQLADNFLSLAVKSLETLYSRLTSRGHGGADINTSKGDVEKDLLRVLSYQAESALAQENHQEAVACMQRCKDMLLRLPKETGYLSLMCYNFGVDSYNMKKYEESSFWLSQSYDIGKMNIKYSPGAKVLRLLATVYLKWDCQQFQEKALNAVNLANKESVHPSGLYLKIRILLRCGAQDDHVRAVTELLESEVPLEVCLSTVKLLMAEDRETLAFDYLKRVCQHFESSPELGSALVLHIELLLQRGKELLGKQKIEDIITGHYTGKQLSPQTLTCLHLLLWDKASKNFETKNFSEALQWYNYSLSFYKAGQMEPNLAKLQRNRASCLLQLEQLDKAKEAIKEAERCDPNSIFTQFSVYKIAVLENNVEKGNSILHECGEQSQALELLKEKIPIVLIVILCFLSFQNEQQDTAMKALESLCEHSKDEAQVLTALRSVTNLSQFCPPDRAVLMGQKTCLLMAAAASLELCRKSPNSDQLTQALEHIQICWEVWKTLKASGDNSKDPTNILLLLYEFEARAKLNDPKVETVLESVLELDNVEIKVLETMAALAMEPPAHFPLLCKKALRIALSLHRKQPQADLTRCSQCVHSLIQLSLPSGVSDVEARVLEEVWGYYEEALSIITADFPEMEILWLLTRAWNTGILLYSLAQYPEAERWCGLGMSFLRHLGSLQESYQTQMSGLSAEHF